MLTMEINEEQLIIISFFVGFVGDSLLQIFVKKFGADWGLKGYFEQHGTAESLYIAAGMMTLFYIIFLKVLHLKPTYLNLAIYGIVVDIIFRKLRIFESLDGYYSFLNYFWSGWWEVFSMCLPLLVYQLVNRNG